MKYLLAGIMMLMLAGCGHIADYKGPHEKHWYNPTHPEPSKPMKIYTGIRP